MNRYFSVYVGAAVLCLTASCFSPAAAHGRQCIQWQVTGSHAVVSCKAAAHARRPFHRHAHRKAHKRARARHGRAHVAAAAGPAEFAHRAAEILPHPAGCPHRAFCGCGAALKIFGRPIRDLWLARNWFRFPPAAPAPGMVAVRSHHVFVIEAVLSRGQVIAYDANSGRHLTRRHVRSLAGYSVRDPHRGRV